MHEEIIRYETSGTINDGSLVKTKERLIGFMEDAMREDGVVPSLDLDPGFTLDYNPEASEFNFVLSVYGIYVGKEGDLWGTAGMTGGKKIMKYTPLAKLREF